MDSLTGRAMFGRKGGDLAGIIIPNVFPGEDRVREFRLRLDNPQLEQRIDGTVHERGKYIQPAERRSILYFPPDVPAELLTDTSTPVRFPGSMCATMIVSERWPLWACLLPKC